MKNLLLAMLLCPLFLFAGQPAIVSGSFTNGSDAVLEFTTDKPYPDTSAYRQSVQSNSGKFEWKTDWEKGNLVSVVIGSSSFQLFLEPGDALQIEVNPTIEPVSISFSGKGAENNRFLFDFNTQFKKDFNVDAQTASVAAAGSIDEFESSIFDQRMKHMRFVKEQTVKNKTTTACNDFINDQVVYNYFAQLLLFSKIKSADPTGMKMIALPSIMMSEMQSASLMDERNMNSPAYRSFLLNYVRYETAKGFNFLKFLDYADMLEREYSYALRYLSGEPFKFFIAHELYTNCDKTESATVKKLHQALAQSDPQGNYVKQVYAKCQTEINAKEVKKEKVEEPKEKASKTSEAAKKSQPFTLIDLKGNKVYLDDFKGKVVYVDFWASWCGPCRQQFPHAKELHKMLTPEQLKQVVFLYISIDDTEEKWKNAIEQNQIEGFHTNSPGGWGSSVTKHFGINSIPRYMLIDKKGNVVDPNAKRPSSGGELLRDILMLL
ncbi:MAG: TlpA disulfide reductase family protein [Chitinophagales bacterium]|nr:TlpA disulfide reductase family protein [Chitinophagales bacterium]